MFFSDAFPVGRKEKTFYSFPAGDYHAYMTYAEERQDIVTVCQSMWTLGWVASSDGNVSMRLDDGNILVTPTGMSKRLITPETLVLADPEGRIIEYGEGERKPSSEFRMHLRCYKERADVKGVVHAHPPAATAFAVAGVPLDEYSMIETVITIGSVPIAPYATPSTEEVPDSIAPFLENHDAILLRSHGALTVGADLMTAYCRMETLEHFARITLNARILGGAEEISRDSIERLISMRESYNVSGRHPGYRKYH